VSRLKRAGRQAVGGYFTNYDKVHDWHLAPGWLDGREALGVFSHAGAARPGYFIELTLLDDRVAAIRDFRYVPYVAREADFLRSKPQ
jgi:RNA polymerase sigma-70 factor (ECF subfamily)